MHICVCVYDLYWIIVLYGTSLNGIRDLHAKALNLGIAEGSMWDYSPCLCPATWRYLCMSRESSYKLCSQVTVLRGLTVSSCPEIYPVRNEGFIIPH